MTRSSLLVVLAWLGAVTLAAAAPADEARPRDLRELQAELANLDEELVSVEGDTAADSDRLRERAEEIREETIYLKVKMRRHQRAGGAGSGVDYAEVEDLRRQVQDLRDDIAKGRRRDTRDVVLPEGEELVVRLDEGLSSSTARVEDRVSASVAEPVRASGVLAIPAASRVRGIVRLVEPARRPSKSGRVELQFDTLYLGRTRLDLAGEVVAVHEELEDSHATEKKAGIGAALGGVLGAILGGGKGALIGVVLGGGGAVVGTRGEDVELPAGTLVTVRLTKPLRVPRGELTSGPREDPDRE